MILRTFSKVYGLAGLRVGYGLCGSDSFRIAVDQVRQPFYLTGAAQAAAVEALKYQDEVERRVVATVAARTAVTEALRERGLWVAESDANFLWVRLAEDGEDGPAVTGLKDRGVLVRAGSALGGPGFARMTLGTDHENRNSSRRSTSCSKIRGHAHERPSPQHPRLVLLRALLRLAI